MERTIRSIDRRPRQRDTFYRTVAEERYRASFAAAAGAQPEEVASAP
jgi:2-iminoacetate synthase ThiH